MNKEDKETENLSKALKIIGFIIGIAIMIGLYFILK